MAQRRITPLLPLAALALAFTACQPAEDDDAQDPATSPALVAEDATLAWSVQLEDDWSPTHAVAVGDVVVVSTGWEIWGVDGGVVTFVDETDTVQLYR